VSAVPFAHVPGDRHCERCRELLAPERVVWLELNCRTGEWAKPGTTDWSDKEGVSQGSFPFGAACARRVLKEQSL
jgi:hypothetical protein